MVTRFLAFLAAAGLVTACGIPGFQLNKEERRADLEWIFSTFQNNYAPLDYKKELHQRTISDLKETCLKRSDEIPQNDDTNDNFNALVNECVSMFKDGHVSLFFGGVGAPGKGKAATLGFNTRRGRTTLADTRVVDSIFVESLLPTEKDTQNFPVKVGDHILKVNGQDVVPYLQQNLVIFRDIGQESSSLTAAALRFGSRSSHQVAIPAEDKVQLQIQRDGSKIIDIELPWIKRDLYEFSEDLARATAKKIGETAVPSETMVFNALVKGAPLLVKNILQLLKVDPSTGSVDIDPAALENIKSNKLSLLFSQSFTVINTDPLSYLISAETDELTELKKERALPGTVVADLSARRFPAFILKATNNQLVGYVRIPSFSVTSDDTKLFGQLMKSFSDMNVKGVIIDLLNNGGGSLVDGLQIARLTTEGEFEYPNIQFALNTGWLESFESAAYSGNSEMKKELARKMLASLKAERLQGKRLSSPVSTLTIFPFVRNSLESQPKLKAGIKVAVLVNEMCASMCDIFSTSLKDNGIATIYGSKAMGAGGNVVTHNSSPSSYFFLNTTESLILRKDGSYIENKGIEPDVAIDTVKDRSSKYNTTIGAALEQLSK